MEDPSGFIPQELSMEKFQVIGGLEATGHSMGLIRTLWMRLHVILFLLFTKTVLE